jgi:3-oxoacyl-[acyl-carrier protein] reductase
VTIGPSHKRPLFPPTILTGDPMAAEARLIVPDLAGKAVLITGASTGIGAALAAAFAAQGAKVAVHYNSSEEPAKAVVKRIADAGGTAVLVHGDVSDPETTRRIVNDAAEALGGLDGLINNAGLMLGRFAFADISDDHYDAVLDLNSRSVFAAVQAALPHLSERGGFIINTTSVAARNGGGGGAVLYAAAKGFVSTITRGLAKELIGRGIRVNGVAPGLIATPFHERYTSDEIMKAQAATIPQGRVGTAEDCVGAYLFLASAALSGYIIGQIIEVNGGQLMP